MEDKTNGSSRPGTRQAGSGWTSASSKSTTRESGSKDETDWRRRSRMKEKVQPEYSIEENVSESTVYTEQNLPRQPQIKIISASKEDEPKSSAEAEVLSSPAHRVAKSRPRRSRNIGLRPSSEKTEGIENLSPLASPAHHSKSAVRQQRGHRESDEIAYQINPVFVNLKDLPKLPKVESINKGQFLASTFKYEKPLSHFKMRVRLLKYPTLSDKYEWAGDFQVLDDRVFSWQEKVFSKSEVELFSDKKNVISDLDEVYHKEILRNPDSSGKYLYSFTQSDLTVCMRTMPRPTVRRCGAKHSRAINKMGNHLTDHKLVNSDNESVIDEQLELGGDEYNRSMLPRHTLSEALVGAMSCFSSAKRESHRTFSHGDGTYQDEIVQHLRRNLQRDRRLQRQVEETEKATKARENLQKAEQELREETRKRNQELKVDVKVRKMKEIEQQKKEKEEEYVKKWVGSKRPSLALSAHMRAGHLTSPTRSTGKGATKPLSGTSVPAFEEMESGWESDDINNRRVRSDWNPRRARRTGTGSVEELLGPRVMESRSFDMSVVNQDSEQPSEDEINIRYPARSFDPISRKQKTRKEDQVRIPSRRMKNGKLQDQSMFIMVSLPHMPRHKRDVTVCAVKTLPRAGVVQLKPAFGYRIIEAKRNHIYRLSWELFSPSTDNEDDGIGPDKQEWDHGNARVSLEDTLDKNSEGSMLDEIGESFETIARNEVRLVFMGEIISTHGFAHGPICVHYLLDLPKGWRNDSVLSSLQGITHRSEMNWSGAAHFSQDFFAQLAFSMDSVEEDEAFSRPMMLLMVVATDGRRVRNEGYAYVPIPSSPGHHSITVPTWKLAPRSVREKMLDVFLDVAPALQDIKAVHVPTCESEECRRPNRLGLETEPSGSVKLRFHVIHQTHSMDFRQNDKIDLIEKMSSATILRSVQTVIEAFQRAQRKAAAANH